MAVITKSGFARKLNISAGRISQYIKAEILKDCLLPGGKLDEDLAIIELDKNIDGAKQMDYQLRVAFDPKTKPLQEYIVLKRFIEKINGVRWIIPVGSTIRLYPDKIGFFPPFKEKERR